MEPDALIDVTTTQHFELNNCDVYSCDEMWEGIRVVPGGDIQIHNGCRIQDAWVAVEVDNPDKVDITDSNFGKCDVGIHFVNINSPSVQRFEGCVFNTGFGLVPYMYENSQFSPTFSVPHVAVWIENSSFVMIGGGGATNLIHQCDFGLIANNSIVAIENSHFRTGFAIPGVGASTSTGIIAENNSHITIVGLGKNGSPTFEDYWVAGIISDNSTVICRQSHFEDVGHIGVWIENTGNHHYSITDNSLVEIDGFGFGLPLHVIRARRGNVQTDIIQGNYLDPTERMNGFAANIHVLNNATDIPSIIHGNELYTHGPIGIFSLNTTSGLTTISGNEIYLTGDAVRGIDVAWNVMGGTVAGINNTLYDNIVTEGNFTLDFGISMFSSPFSLICNNTLDEVQTGVRLIGNCMNTTVSENEFIENNIGLLLQGNGVNLGIGFNDHKANTWTGTFTTTAASHTGSDPLFSPFWVNNVPNEPCEDPDYFPNSNGTQSVVPSAGWFLSESDCEEWCVFQPLPPGGDGDGLDQLDSAIINGQYQLTGQTAASVWHSEYTEYQKIKSNESSLQNNTLAMGYLAAMANSSIAKFYSFENKVTEAFRYSVTTRDSLEHHSYMIDSLMETLPSIYAVYAADTTGNTALANQYFQTAHELHTSKIRFEYWDSVSHVEKTVKLTEATTILNQVTPLNVFETNLKTANSFRLTSYDGGLNESEIIIADSIANTCFDEAGPAIYIAYTLLPDTQYIADFPKFSCIDSTTEPDKPSFLQSKEQRLSIYPNPTNADIEIAGLENTELPVTQAVIYDLYGKEMGIFNIGQGNNLNVEHLPSGVYFINFLSGKETLSTLRFIKTSK